MNENQLKTASELNQILSRELERTSQIFEISVERQSTLNGRIINWQLDPIKDNLLQIIDEQKSFSGLEYHQMLFCLIKFLLGDQIYYEWLSDGVLPSQMENHTIIIKSIEYPPLLIDPFGQYDQWMEKY
ncbi:unnamed protein product [Adineta steineri]|uniref:Uncharacterized protein n=1 Tax=Adineta steineri TaxID=433720 RepID=A0A819VU02_9BILA|nr:unnamed protein product [Adineta steineri]